MFYIVHDSWPVLFGKFSAAGCPRRNSAVCWNCAPCGWSLVMAAELKSTGDQKWPRMAMKHGGKCWGNIWTNEKKDKKRLAASARVFFWGAIRKDAPLSSSGFHLVTSADASVKHLGFRLYNTQALGRRDGCIIIEIWEVPLKYLWYIYDICMIYIYMYVYVWCMYNSIIDLHFILHEA